MSDSLVVVGLVGLSFILAVACLVIMGVASSLDKKLNIAYDELSKERNKS